MADKENGEGISSNTTKKRRKAKTDLDTSEAELENKKAKLEERRDDVPWSEEMDHNLIKYVEEFCEHLLQNAHRPKYLFAKNIKWSAVAERFYTESAIRVDAGLVRSRWEELTRKVRKIRTVPELLEDVKEYINHHMDMVPKKPPTSYQIFCNSKRSRINEKYPTLSFAELQKKLGKKWREMQADKKAKYEKKALKVKEKYDEEIKKWQSDNPDATPVLENGKKKKSVCVTPFDVFCKKKSSELQAKYPELDSFDLQEKLKKRWEKLKEQKIKDYAEQAEMINDEAKKKASEKQTKAIKKSKQDPLTPKKPQSAYILYYKDQRQNLLKQNPELDFATVSKKISASWKEVSSEESNRYKEQAMISKETYLKQLKEFEERKVDTV